MKPFSAVIVDDERPARNRLRQLLSTESDFQVIGECGDGQEALELLRRVSPDLLFLDMQMPELDGLAILEAVGPKQIPAVVFVTAYDKYALQAFEVNAVDYLLKPFDRRRFQDTLDRARVRLSSAIPGDMPNRLLTLLEGLAPSHRERIVIKNNGKVTLLDTSSIDWIEAADNYVCLHCGGTRHLVRETMSAIETRMDRRTFIRIHRSVMVNLDRIVEMQPWFRGDYLVILKDGTKLKLSRTYRDSLKALLSEGATVNF